MDPATLSPQAEATAQQWIDTLQPGKPAFLASRRTDWRMSLLEQAAAEDPASHHVVLDLNETIVDAWEPLLLEKLGAELVDDPQLVLHVVHLEHSLLESLASGQSLFEGWDQASIGIASGNLRIYGDDALQTALASQAPHFWARFDPVATLETDAPPLPYDKLEALGTAFRDGDTSRSVAIAEQLSLAGALAAAQLWFEHSLTEGYGSSGSATLGLGELALHRGKFPEAMEQLQAALNLLDVSASFEKGRAYLALARIQFSQRQWKAAIAYLQQARSSFSPSDHPEEWGEATRILARSQEELGQALLAVAAYLEAAQHWAATPAYAAAAAKSFQHAGAICQNQLLHADALAHFSAAIPFAETAKDEFLVESLEDSVESMKELVAKTNGKAGKKGFLGRLFS